MNNFLKKWELSPKYANKRVGWGPLASVLVGIGSYVIPTLILGIVIALVAAARGVSVPTKLIDTDNLLQTLLFAIFIAMSAVAIIARYVRDKGGTKALGFTQFKKEYLKYGVIAYAAYFVTFIAVLSIVTMFNPEITDQAQDLGIADPSGALNMTYVFVLLVILPPIYEEILFRGFFFQGVAKFYGFIPGAILVNGLFGLAHGQLNVGIDTFILGVIASWLVWKTKSLWPAIALHAIKNLVAYSFRFVFV